MTPEEAARQRALDEGFTAISERLPILWRRLYERTKEEGFSANEAFLILQTYIMSQGAGISFRL